MQPQRGAEAEDVTENIIYVEGVPVELWTHDDHGNKFSPLNINCCIRGEIICKKKTFAALNEEFAKKGMKVYANKEIMPLALFDNLKIQQLLGIVNCHFVHIVLRIIMPSLIQQKSNEQNGVIKH